MSDDLSMMGNFKGVMLCNRPAQIPGSLQTIVGPTSSSGPTRPAFVSSVVPETQLGLPPVRHSRVTPQRRDTKNKSDDVTWRHKRWLGEFQERRTAIATTMEQRVQEQQEKARRLAERSQAMRDAIRGIKQGPGDKEEKASAIEAALSGRPKFVPTEYVDVSQQYPSGAPAPAPQQQFADYEEIDADTVANAPVPTATQPKTQRSRAAAPKAAAKPGWARTEAEDDDVLDAEADSLMEFAAGLDYNKYIDDLEVREAIKFVQDRVKSLEESKQSAEAEEEMRQQLIAAGELEEVYVVDDTQPPDADGNPAMKKIVRRVKKTRAPIPVQHEEAWNNSSAFDDGAQSERDRLAQQDVLTRTVLESNRALRNIHSSASVRAIVEKEQQHTQRTLRDGGQAIVYANSGATSLRRPQLPSVSEGGQQQTRPPIITTIHEKETTGNKGPNPSNLPFLYRHPGI